AMIEGIEFGKPVRNQFFKNAPASDGKPISSESAVPCGKVVAGLATAYFEYHSASSGQNEIFARGCFDLSLKARPQLDLLLGHKAELKIADSAGGRFEVHSDLDGLW